MIFNDKKFNKEINLLKSIASDDSAGLESVKASLMKQVAETNQDQKRYIEAERKTFMNPVMRYAATTLVGLGLVGGTVFASNSAKPGDVLFPVKKVSEKVQISLQTSQQAKAELQSKIAEDRIDSVTQVSAENKDTAKVEAKTELNSAIDVLTKVQADLQAKGNTTAADALSRNIARLKQKAAENKIEADDQAEVKDSTEAEDQNDQNSQGDQNEDSGKEHSSPTIDSKAKVNVNGQVQIKSGDSHDQEQPDQQDQGDN